MILFRPTGLEELRLVFHSRLLAWPPRLPEQPIFYPVFSIDYARQIARDWNTQADRRAGYVTRFAISDEFANRFRPQVVGGRQHQELWVPADQLEELNANLQGPIDVVEGFFANDFLGLVPDKGMLAHRPALEQLKTLAAVFASSHFDFLCELAANDDAVFLHYPFWLASQLSPAELSGLTQAEILANIALGWRSTHPDIPLCQSRSAA